VERAINAARVQARAEKEESERVMEIMQETHAAMQETQAAGATQLQAEREEAQSVIAELMEVAQAAQLDARAAREEAEVATNAAKEKWQHAAKSAAAAAAAAAGAEAEEEAAVAAAVAAAQAARVDGASSPQARSGARLASSSRNPSSSSVHAQDAAGSAAVDSGTTGSRERRKSIDMKNQLRMERHGSINGGGGLAPRVSRGSVGSDSRTGSRERRKSVDMRNELKMARQGSIVGVVGGGGRGVDLQRVSIDSVGSVEFTMLKAAQAEFERAGTSVDGTAWTEEHRRKSRERRKSIEMKNELRIQRQGSVVGGGATERSSSRDSVGSDTCDSGNTGSR
jgi:hypothetical protein